MQIGLISDVHGNYPALKAVLDDMPAVDAVYHCGDLVGYNPFPHEVLETFDNRAIETIQGNHDFKISGDVESMGNAPEPNSEKGSIRPGALAREAGLWTASQLTTKERQFLADLPRELAIDGGTVKLVHGMPGDQEGRLYPDEYSEAYFDDERVLVHGHTHVQHMETFGDRLLINPGSVGQPRDGDPRAAYAVLDLETYTATLHRVNYPIGDVTSAISDTEIPDLLCHWLEQGEIVTDY